MVVSILFWETYGIIDLFIYFFSIDSNSRARVCVYVCVYIRMRVRIRIHIRAPMIRIIFISVLSSRRCGPGMEDFFFRGFPMVGWLVDWFVGGGSGRSTAWCVTYIYIYYVDAVSISMYMYIRYANVLGIYNIYRRTVYPISKIGCCWCCYYYCRCCCCACSCCWCLVILLYTPLYSPRHIHSSLALFFCLSPSLSSSLSLSGYFPHRFLYRVYGMHESSFRSLKENIFSLLTLVYFISRFYFVVKKRRCRHREQSSKVKLEQEASWEKKIE